MKHIRTGIAGTALVLAAQLAPAAPAHADPTFMTFTEWSGVSEGQTKGKVETNCACFGSKTGLTLWHNGNSYTFWQYLSHVGTTYVAYRVGSDGLRHVGYEKSWCVAPAGDQGQPDGDCNNLYFS
jgi:hypothetical protein